MSQLEQFERVYEIMSASFPVTEYRTKSGQEKLLDRSEYRLLTERDEEERIIAFLAVWEFPALRFIEHLAVDPSVRGGGVGNKLVRKCLEEQPVKPTILEVELPEDELSARRISFYERLGFRLNEYSYVQPPLREGGDPLPLKIMSYPQLLTEQEFLACRAILYSEVYRVSES